MNEIHIPLSDTCITCGHKFDWDEVTITKLPEGVSFCMTCAEKYKDNKQYKGIDKWAVVEYRPGISFYHGANGDYHSNLPR